GRASESEREVEAMSDRERDVDVVGIQGAAARDESDLVETVCAARSPPDPYLQARLLPGNLLSGFDPALIQGVFTPLNGAGFADYTRALSCDRCTERSSI